MYRKYIKRGLDIFFSLLIILLLAPLLLILFLLIKLDSPGAVFFLQERVGKDGQVFMIYKLRTMVDKKREVACEIYKGNQEVTGIGSVLRRFKLDEIPQVFNVFLGDMSFIGPRPALPQLYVDIPDARKRLQVRPGMTGLAQVHGNIYLSWEERVRLDQEYVDNLCFGLDRSILFRTIMVVLLGEDKFLRR